LTPVETRPVARGGFWSPAPAAETLSGQLVGGLGGWVGAELAKRDVNGASRKPCGLPAIERIGWNSLYWDNHDQPRVVSLLGCATRKRPSRNPNIVSLLEVV
jgi:hypothetical protein